MSAPRRWVDDPDTDAALRELLRGAPSARPLDGVTRRRLGAKVARASALPAAAAGWLFVKSATAALGVVLGTGALAVSTGLVEWSPRERVEMTSRPAPGAVPVRSVSPVPAPRASSVRELADEPRPSASSASPSPVVSSVTSTGGTLSAEAALLERARREMRSAPAAALTLASEHASRFPQGQLASERTLIQIDALHRLGRDAEARALAHALLAGASGGLYAERVKRLLGAEATL